MYENIASTTNMSKYPRTRMFHSVGCNQIAKYIQIYQYHINILYDKFMKQIDRNRHNPLPQRAHTTYPTLPQRHDETRRCVLLVEYES